jgi:hypothetical protein
MSKNTMIALHLCLIGSQPASTQLTEHLSIPCPAWPTQYSFTSLYNVPSFGDRQCLPSFVTRLLLKIVFLTVHRDAGK